MCFCFYHKNVNENQLREVNEDDAKETRRRAKKGPVLYFKRDSNKFPISFIKEKRETRLKIIEGVNGTKNGKNSMMKRDRKIILCVWRRSSSPSFSLFLFVNENIIAHTTHKDNFWCVCCVCQKNTENRDERCDEKRRKDGNDLDQLIGICYGFSLFSQGFRFLYFFLLFRRRMKDKIK